MTWHRNHSERFPLDPNAPRPRPAAEQPPIIGPVAGAELRRLVHGEPERS